MSILPNRELLDVPTEENAPLRPTGEFVEEETVVRSQWRLFWRRFFRHRMAVISSVVLLLIIFVCFNASWLAPYPKNHQNLTLGAVGPSAEHWFGTDDFGGDQLTDMMYAGQISLKTGLAVALLSTVSVTTSGARPGHSTHCTDHLYMRLT